MVRTVDAEQELAFTSYLRVVAIVGVVLIHVAGLTFIRPELHGTPVWWLSAALTFGSRWAVIVFVMVSGALLLRPPAQPDPGRFYRRRLARLGVPLVVWHVVYIAISASRWEQAPRELLADFLRGESYTALYFFWLILGLYAVVPLLWPVVQAWSRRRLVVAGALLATVPAVDMVLRGVIALLDQEDRVLPYPTLVTQFVPYVGFFLLGWALRDVVLRGLRLAGATLLLAVCLVEMVLQATLAAPLQPTATPPHGVVNALLPLNYQGFVVGISALAVFVVVRSVVHPASAAAQPPAAVRARRLGELTFGVFASHLLVLHLIDRMPRVSAADGATGVVGLVLLVVAVLAGAFALTWVLARTPFLRRTV